MEWYELTLTGAAHVPPPQDVAWHGRLMTLAWAVLAPLGVLVARFYKVMPSQSWPQELDNQCWWHAHRLAQYLAFGLTALAIVFIWHRISISRGTLPSLHALFGWLTLVALAGQVGSAWLRGSKGGPGVAGDHYQMSTRRRLFEACHKTLGYIALGLGFASIVVGLYTSGAPRWMWLIILCWTIAYCMWFTALHRATRIIPTYQAIFGPDKTHPGNVD